MRSKRLYIECPYCPERFIAWKDGQSHLKYTHPLDEPTLREVYWEGGEQEENTATAALLPQQCSKPAESASEPSESNPPKGKQ